MKKVLKLGFSFLSVVLFIFTVMPQNSNATVSNFSNNNIDSFDYENLDLDKENTELLEKLDKHIELLENGDITFDEQAAKEDGLDPEILDIIMSLTDNGKNQNGGISTFDFKYPFFHYGNYCGVDGIGGVPIDNLDRACRAHDLCFTNLDDMSSANKRCNRNLVRSALPIVQATNSHSAKGITARIAVTVFSKKM